MSEALPLWRIFFPAVRALGLFLLPVRVEGGVHVPQGGYLLVSNHLSWIDPAWIEFVIRRPIRFMAKRELFQIPILGWALLNCGVFPIERHSADRRAISRALAFLAGGEVVGIFPEGHRSRAGPLIQASPGVGFLARRSGAAIVPVGISGSREARLGKFWRRDVTIRFGEPFRAADLDSDDERALADAIMRRIAALLPEGQRGVYAA